MGLDGVGKVIVLAERNLAKGFKAVGTERLGSPIILGGETRITTAQKVAMANQPFPESKRKFSDEAMRILMEGFNGR